MTEKEYRELRAHVPEEVYALYGGASGASDTYVLTWILHEVLALRKEISVLKSETAP